MKLKIREMTFLEAFQEFIITKKSEGCATRTLESYVGTFYRFAKCIDSGVHVSDLTTEDFRTAVARIADSGISPNSVRSYTAGMKSFLSWCHEEGLCDAEIALFQGRESVPECYSVAELQKLLKRPNMKKCDFAELRNWTIINLLVNNGCRASTITHIQIRDVELDQHYILARHMKRRKSITIPLSDRMVMILREYLRHRGGGPEDWLFPTETGQQLQPAGLRSAITRYNHSRGVARTGIHKFRNTFARLYLIECSGDALKLQRLLGHSTLDMTKHYVKLFSQDLIDEFRNDSPLDHLTGGKIQLRK